MHAHVLIYIIMTGAINAFLWNLVGIPMDSNGNCSGRLPDSDHSARFWRIPLEFPWNWKPEWLRLQPTEFRWISADSAISLGFHWNSWEMVKTSNQSRWCITTPRNEESYFVLHHFSSCLRRYQSIDGASISP
jgi:hypothetical protein